LRAAGNVSLCRLVSLIIFKFFPDFLTFVMSTIHITLNGEKRELTSGLSVDDLLKQECAESQKVAVVVNENIVRPDDRASLILQDGDQVELLIFAGGG